MSDYKITLAEGVTYTTAWRDEHPNLVKAFKVEKAAMTELFSDSNAVAFRAYLGYDGTKPQLVMVGVDNEGKDILTNVYDHALPCPSDCDTNSVLNKGE